MLHSGGDLLSSVWAFQCVPDHTNAPLCPSQGTPNQSTMLTDRKRHRRRVQIAYKDYVVGGGKVCAYIFLKRESIEWLHPFLVVLLASVVCRLLRMSLVSVNAGWGHVSCVVHMKAGLFPL